MSRISDSVAMLENVKRLTPRILVGVSGGKDSLVSLALACDVFGSDNVVGYFKQLVVGVECEQAPVRLAAARHKVEIITVPHEHLSQLLRRSICRPYVNGAENIRPLKQIDIERYVRAKTKIDWCLYGHREVESLVRLAMLRKIQGLDVKGRRVYAIWQWKNKEIFAFLKARGIPVPVPLAQKYAGQSSGVGLEPFAMAWLKKNHPCDYALYEKMFPYVEALIMRHGAASTEVTKKPRKVKAKKSGENGPLPDGQGDGVLG